MVLNPESPGTGGHQRVCLGSKRFFFFFLNFGPKPSPEEFTISPRGRVPPAAASPVPARASGLRGSGHAGAVQGASGPAPRAAAAPPLARMWPGGGGEGVAAAAPGAPGAFSTFANAAAPRPAPRRRSSARPRRLRARPALLSSLPPMAFRARGRRPPLPPLLLLLLWVTGQAAPVAGLGLGSDTEPQIERRFVPDECPRTVRSGDFVRYHYVGTFPDGQKFDSRYRSPRGRPASALPLSGQAFRARRTSPSPAPRASRSSLPPRAGLPDPEPRSPRGERPRP